LRTVYLLILIPGLTLLSSQTSSAAAPDPHTVIFDQNTGTGTMADQTSSTARNLTANSFTKSGYTFTGWSTLANGRGTNYLDGASYPFAADVMLFAQWRMIPVIVVASASSPYVAPLKSQAPITLTSSVDTIEFGGSFKIKALGGESAGALTYSSSGVALCAVDASGNVTALGKGTCTITATKAGDSTYASITSNSVTVTVTDITVAGVVAVGEVIAPTLSISKPVAGTTTLRFKIDPIYSGDRVSVLLGNKVNGKTTYKTLGSATVSTSGAVTFKSKVKFNKGNLVRLKYGSTVIITKTV
jgi:hypothetical protein